MSRKHLRIPRDIRERVLNHRVGSAVEQAYDWHDYIDDKREALTALGHELDRILSAPDNVVPLRASA